MTLGWLVESRGFFAVARLPKEAVLQEQCDLEDPDDVILLLRQTLGDAFLDLEDSILRPPLWRNSIRLPTKLSRTEGPVTSCRYGHRLKVPPTDELDRMLKRVRGANDVIYLPAVRG